MNTVHVFVTPKSGVLDPQGKAIESSLKLKGYEGISQVNLGRFIELKIASKDDAMIEKICNDLLANTVIEDYRYEWVNQYND